MDLKIDRVCVYVCEAMRGRSKTAMLKIKRHVEFYCRGIRQVYL